MGSTTAARTHALGKKTQASEVIEGISLLGKNAIVTGASSGIGVETARVLAAAGANVVMACRSVEAGEKYASEIRSSLGDKGESGTVEVRPLDLTDLASVRTFVDGIRAREKELPLHLLVNNAGVMATPLGATKQGCELQIGTNHVGHFLLTTLLLPLFDESAPSRIVNVSSKLHERGRGERLLETLTKDAKFTRRKYVPFDAYGDSKLANVLFTKQLAKLVETGDEKNKNLLAFSLHPGVIKTNLTRSMGVAGAVFRAVGGLFTKSIPQGAATTVFAATAPELEKNDSGAYLSDCQITRPSADARDADLAAKLWEISETIVAKA